MKKSPLMKSIEEPTNEEKCIRMLYDSLVELISQKAIGNMVFNIGRLNEGMMLAEKIFRGQK